MPNFQIKPVVNDVAIKISDAMWRGKSAMGGASRPVIFGGTKDFELADHDGGKVNVRNISFSRRNIAIASVTSTGHRVSLEEDDRLSYLLVTKGQAEIELGNERIIARPGQGVLLGTGSRTTRVGSRKSAIYEGAVLLVPKGVLQDAGLDLDDPPFSKVIGQTGGAVAPASDPVDRLNGYIGYMLNNLLKQTSAMPSSRVARSTEQLLLDLFSETAAEILQREQPVLVSADLKKVQEAEDFIRANLGLEMQLADICQAVGVSSRSLQLAFQRCRGVSPMASLRRIQLEEVHRRLLDKTNDKNLTEIAHDCGWTHLGRLSAAFRKQFGEAPSQIRRRARSGRQ